MAQKVFVELEDDLDGSEAAETVSFALDGVSYEIDLSDDNAIELREALGQFVEHGRRIGGRRRSVLVGAAIPARSSTAERNENQAIRAWARAAGFEVSERGRIPAYVANAYQLRRR